MTSDDLAARLDWLCDAAVHLAPPLLIPGGPRGTRVIVEVTAATLKGPKIEASLEGRAAADWLIVSPAGDLGSLDVRSTYRTHDGALIYTHYQGRVRIRPDGRNLVYVAPLFETSDPRYAWLNGVQGVGKGLTDPPTGRLLYRFYTLD